MPGLKDATEMMLYQWAGNRNRWAQIACWTAADLRELHTQEKSLTKSSGKLGAIISDAKMMGELNLRNSMLPFWDRRIDEYERKNRMDLFAAQIYTTWAPVVQSHIEREMSDKQNRRECDFVEVNVLHECDRAIQQRGIKPNRLFSGNPEKQEEKKKTVEQAGMVYGS